MPLFRILFIDAYDSFSNNITSLLKENLPVTVEVIHIDDPRFVFNDDAFRDFLNKFDAVVAGPGPGHPANLEDVGLIGKLWHLPEDFILPILGICLGFQSLALAFGATVERLKEPRHGLVRPMTHCGQDIFAGVKAIDVTQYHSLHAKLSEVPAPTAPTQHQRWLRQRELLPLAWDLSDESNGPILMGLRHVAKPFWGVQYHPESVCSHGGRQLVLEWWREVCQWNALHSRKAIDGRQDSGRASPDTQALAGNVFSSTRSVRRSVQWRCVQVSEAMDTAAIAGLLRDTEEKEPIVLESGVRNFKLLNPETGRHSVICLPSKDSLQICWSVERKKLTIRQGDETIDEKKASVSDVFDFLDDLVQEHRAHDGLPNVPFWGGLVGFASYEAGLETIDVQPSTVDSKRPDVWFTMVERSIIIDHTDKLAYVQSIRCDDAAWLCEVTNRLTTGAKIATELRAPTFEQSPPNIISGPPPRGYVQKVEACQSHLRAGSSYELCLTDQTLVRNSAEPWQLYQKLRQTNPAPFGAYLRLEGQDNGVSIISSSPERFLSWSRDGRCQFRPIKGTVKKGPDVTREKAEAMLASEKEHAENLMIVDLIRHDLSGVGGYALPVLLHYSPRSRQAVVQ